MIHNQATPPDLQPHGVPPQLARAVKRMLSRVPAQRQQTMREVIQDLRTAGRTQKSIPAFAMEGTQVSAGSLTTEIGAVVDVPQISPAVPPAAFGQAPSYQAPIQLPAQHSYLTPTPIPYQSQPTPVSQQGYQPTPVPQQPAPPHSYLSSAPGSFQQSPPPQRYQSTQYQSQPSGYDPMRRARLRRIGEFLLGAAVVVIYLIVYWQDTLMFLRNFAKSLRFGL